MDNNLLELLLPIGVLGTIGFVVVTFVKILTAYYLRKKMIERGLGSDDAQAILQSQMHTEENKYSSLKWGLIIFFGGLSLILMEFIPVNPQSPLPYGMFAFFIAMGFLIYFFIAHKLSAKEKI